MEADLAPVAAEPNTTVKISALGTNDHHWTVDSIRRIVLDTIDVFGPSRCMFASNFPVDGLYSTFGALYAAFDTITAGLRRHERADLFAGTARRFYRIPTTVLNDPIPSKGARPKLFCGTSSAPNRRHRARTINEADRAGAIEAFRTLFRPARSTRLIVRGVVRPYDDDRPRRLTSS